MIMNTKRRTAEKRRQKGNQLRTIRETNFGSQREE
jgi:hypothetical protein